MYRSQSSSSVFFDGLLHSDGRSWTAADPPAYRNNEVPYGTSTRLSSTSRVPREAPVTLDTLTSALTGSKMATNTAIPTGSNKRPLPKALLPKSARAPATPPVMVGSSYGLNSPLSVRRSSVSSSLTSTVTKSPALAPERRIASQRLESTPAGSTSSFPAQHPADHQVTESDRWTSANARPQTAGIYPSGNWAQRPFVASVDAAGRDGGRYQSVGHPLAGWSSLKVTPVRRREPVVQDSIIPILKAALGKDNDPHDKRTDKEEEAINRQVFGRTARAAGPGTLRTFSTYGSTDDVFARSNSYLGLQTMPRVHLKSHSEVASSRGFDDGIQRQNLRNSLSSAASNPNIQAPKIPGAPGVRETGQKEFSSYVEAQSQSISQNLHPTPSEGLQHPHPSSRSVVPSNGTKPTSDEHLSWNSPRSSSNSMHSKGTGSSPARLTSWEPNLPPSAPPIPAHRVSYLSTDRSLPDMDNRSCSWYDPLPVLPRKIIRNPSVVSESPRNLEEMLRPLRSPVFFGKSFSPASYPLLANVGTEVLDGDVDPFGTIRDSRDAGHKDTVAVGWKEPGLPETSAKKNMFVSSKHSPTEVASFVKRTTGVENLPVPPPPIEFRDEATVFSSSLATTTAAATTAATPAAAAAAVNIPPVPLLSHQATDSINTEDSGLDRWEKEGHDHSADELEMGHPSSAAAGDRSSATKRRSCSWREDASEGRGSLSSSPRPHNSDEHLSSPTNEQYSNISNSNGFVDDKMIYSNSILRQLLAENARQTTRNSKDSTLTSGSEREPRSMELEHHPILSKVTESDIPLLPNVPPPSDFDSYSNVSTGGIDSESCHSFSTAVQSTATVSGGNVGTAKWSRLTENVQMENGEAKLRGSNAEDGSLDKGSLEERYAIVSEAGRDFGEPLIPLPGVKEYKNSSRKVAPFEALQYGHVTEGSGGEKEQKEETELMVIEIVKGSVGVGFCIEGGKGSLLGDRPIVVKRVFKGGLTEGAANLRPGDELLSIRDQSLVGFSHFDAWKYIKTLPNGTFPLAIRRKMTSTQQPQLL